MAILYATSQQVGNIFFIGYDQIVCSENLLSYENCEEIKMIYGVAYKVEYQKYNHDKKISGATN